MKKIFEFIARYPVIAAAITIASVVLISVAVVSLTTRESKPVGIPAEAVEYYNKAQQAIGAASELRRQIEEIKTEKEQLKQQYLELEKELADAKQKTEQARQVYLGSRSITRHTPVGSGTTTSELCTRAAKLNIQCE